MEDFWAAAGIGLMFLGMGLGLAAIIWAVNR